MSRAALPLINCLSRLPPAASRIKFTSVQYIIVYCAVLYRTVLYSLETINSRVPLFVFGWNMVLIVASTWRAFGGGSCRRPLLQYTKYGSFALFNSPLHSSLLTIYFVFKFQRRMEWNRKRVHQQVHNPYGIILLRDSESSSAAASHIRIICIKNLHPCFARA